MSVALVFFSHYRRHPGQLAALLLILACAAALWSGVQALTGGAREAVAGASEALQPRFAIERNDGQAVTVADFAHLRRAGACVTPQLELRIGADAPRLLGIDPFSAACLGDAGSGAAQLPLLLDALDRPLVLGRAGDLAHWRRLRPQPDFEGQVVAQLPAGLLLADIAVVEHLSGAQETRLELLSDADGSAALPAGYRRHLVDYGVESDPLVDAFLLSLDALALLALLVAALLLRSVYRLALVQRRRTLDILHRVGVTRRRLHLCLGLEVLLLVLIGGLAGSGGGLLLARLLSDGFEATLDGLYDVGTMAGPAAFIDVGPGALLLLLSLTAWSALDLWRRPGAGKGGGRRRLAPVVALLLLAGAVLLTAKSLGVIYAASAATLLAAGLLMPPLLAWLLEPRTGSGAGSLWEWSRSEMAALSRLLSLPLVALAFAVAASVAVQAMVASFESTFERWLEQRLQGDLYLDPGRPLPAADDWRARLEALPGVAGVLPMVRGQGLLNDRPVDILGVDPGSPLLGGWRFLAGDPAPWQMLDDDAVLINEQLARRRALAPGERVELRLGEQLLQRWVLAVYADYGRPEAEVLLPLEALPADLPRRYASFVLQLDGADWSDWSRRYDWLADSRLRDQQSLKAAARAAFDRTFRLTRTLEHLTLALAGLALALMALAMLRLRRGVYSLLFAWGLPRNELRRILVLQAMLVTGLLGLLAIPLGLFLGWVLVAKINPAAFGWSLPLGLYPGFWLQVWLLCLLIGALAGLVQGDPVRLESLKNE
ncbi:ABC transporter permease [Marinobacterium nitratireducens]|uniref:ABC transporter permease n=1 Tax=Marinobacterium nitratireducens TaxID=518897 RepID=A0A917ZFJ7_9GAMM|nr:ABC transporter permease [Marinobacterium nitratireducens]GGO82248.1 ABC transporter permease [Marinobacterium nitratireducens]